MYYVITTSPNNTSSLHSTLWDRRSADTEAKAFLRQNPLHSAVIAVKETTWKPMVNVVEVID